VRSTTATAAPPARCGRREHGSAGDGGRPTVTGRTGTPPPESAARSPEGVRRRRARPTGRATDPIGVPPGRRRRCRTGWASRPRSPYRAGPPSSATDRDELDRDVERRPAGRPAQCTEHGTTDDEQEYEVADGPRDVEAQRGREPEREEP